MTKTKKFNKPPSIKEIQTTNTLDHWNYTSNHSAESTGDTNVESIRHERDSQMEKHLRESCPQAQTLPSAANKWTITRNLSRSTSNIRYGNNTIQKKHKSSTYLPVKQRMSLRDAVRRTGKDTKNDWWRRMSIDALDRSFDLRWDSAEGIIYFIIFLFFSHSTLVGCTYYVLVGSTCKIKFVIYLFFESSCENLEAKPVTKRAKKHKNKSSKKHNKLCSSRKILRKILL